MKKNSLVFNVFDENNNYTSGEVYVELLVFIANFGVPSSFIIKNIETTDSATWWLDLSLSEKEKQIKFWWEHARMSPITDPLWWIAGSTQKRVAVPCWLAWDARPSGKGF